MALNVDTQNLENYPGNVKRVSVDYSAIVEMFKTLITGGAK